MKTFIIDVARCNGCYCCQIACKDEHVDNDWSPIAAPQPDTGHFWFKMTEETQGSVPKVKVAYTPTLCNHCDNAPCLEASDAVYRRDDGLIVIDSIKAKGDKALVDSCPYGAIYWNAELELAQKCTGCAHLIDDGRPPRCVEACCTDALLFGEEEDFVEQIAAGEVLNPEAGTSPRVHYLNLPKNFVAGEVWDPASDEVVIGAKVTLTNKAANEVQSIETDDFGDFWFTKLQNGTYSINVEKEGYGAYSIDALQVERSVNVGDIALLAN